MDTEAMEFEEISELEMLLASLRPDSAVLPSAAAQRPRTTSRIRPIRTRRPSRLSRPYPQPVSAPVGLPALRLDRLIAAAGMGPDQLPEARRSQVQDPEVEFDMTPPPSIDHIRRGVPSSAGGFVPTTRPHTPVHYAIASTSTRTRARVVKFRSAYWAWIVLSSLPMDPLPPSDCNTSE